MNVLVDTSIWSVALRKKNSSEKKQIQSKLIELVEQHRVKMIGPIRQELLSGISNYQEFLKLKNILEAFPDLIMNKPIYERAAEMYNICRKKGIQGSHIDFLICAAADFFHLSILTLDKDFIHYAKHLPIILESQEHHGTS